MFPLVCIVLIILCLQFYLPLRYFHIYRFYGSVVGRAQLTPLFLLVVFSLVLDLAQSYIFDTDYMYNQFSAVTEQSSVVVSMLQPLASSFKERDIFTLFCCILCTYTFGVKTMIIIMFTRTPDENRAISSYTDGWH